MATSNQGNKQGGGQGRGTSNRGFASMDPERQREIASEGGKAAHERGTAHEFTSEEARRAGSMSHGNRQSESSASRSGGEDKKSEHKSEQRSEQKSEQKGEQKGEQGASRGGAKSGPGSSGKAR